MTTANEMSEKAAKKEADRLRAAEVEAEQTKLNADRKGKGTRVFVGFTRGKGSQKIQYENWDETLPETLPTTLSEFMELRKEVSDEPSIIRRLILGDNEVFYSEASDPVAEFVEPGWPEEIQKFFKISVKNYAAATKLPLEDVVALIKPGIVASQAKSATK